MTRVGVILAGGKSTRMKQDKALLRLDGRSLLQRQFDLLERILGEGFVIVSGDRPGFPHLKDLTPHLGPLEGLRTVCRSLALSNARASVLVVPVDMPFITEAGCARLLQVAGNTSLTKFQGQQLPLVIHDLSGVLRAIEELKNDARSGDQGRYSFRDLMERLDVDEVPPEPDHFFRNLNTPEDWNVAIS